MYVLTEYIVRGVQAGSIYGLLALPMSLLFATAGTIDFAGQHPRGRTPGGEFPLQPPGCAQLVSPATWALRRLVRQFPRPNRARRPLTSVRRPLAVSPHSAHCGETYG